MFYPDFMLLDRLVIFLCSIIFCGLVYPTENKEVKVEYQTERPDITKEKGIIYGDIDNILKRKFLVVCSNKDTNRPLFLMKKHNKKNKFDLTGEDIELAKKLAKALGVKLIFRCCYEHFDDVIDAIEHGEGDIGISELSYTTHRSRKVIYTHPYVILKKMLLVNRQTLEMYESKSVKELIENGDFPIATEDHSYIEFAQELFPNTKILVIDDWDNKIGEKIKSKELIATLNDETKIKTLLNRSPSLSLNLVPLILKGEKDCISMAVNFKGLKLSNWINKFLKSEVPIENIDNLMKKYEDYIY